MQGRKANTEIIAQLKQDLLLLQGFRPAGGNTNVDLKLGPIREAFPNNTFPTTAVHEFLTADPETTAATSGFVAGLLAGLMQQGGVCIWVSAFRTLFPQALQLFDISPDRVVFVDLKRETDVCWAVEEALKCKGVAAVVGELRAFDFTVSRRLQLAVESSKITGFILRHQMQRQNATASVSRWKVTPLPSEPGDGLPGVGHPRWLVELQKVRNGRPGNWQVEWQNGRFCLVHEAPPVISESVIRKIG